MDARVASTAIRAVGPVPGCSCHDAGGSSGW